MKQAKKLRGAAALGIKVIVDPSLNESSRKVLFPEQLAAANNLLANIDWDQAPEELRQIRAQHYKDVGIEPPASTGKLKIVKITEEMLRR